MGPDAPRTRTRHAHGRALPEHPSTTACPASRVSVSEQVKGTVMKGGTCHVLPALMVVGAAAAAAARSDCLGDIFDKSNYRTSDVVFPAHTFVFAQGGSPEVGGGKFGLRD